MILNEKKYRRRFVGPQEECGPMKGDSSKPGVKAGPRTAAWGPGRGGNLIGAKLRREVPGTSLHFLLLLPSPAPDTG